MGELRNILIPLFTYETDVMEWILKHDGLMITFFCIILLIAVGDKIFKQMYHILNPIIYIALIEIIGIFFSPVVPHRHFMFLLTVVMKLFYISNTCYYFCLATSNNNLNLFIAAIYFIGIFDLLITSNDIALAIMQLGNSVHWLR